MTLTSPQRGSRFRTAPIATAEEREGEPKSADGLRPLRWLIWVYFGLLIFEGALRKWVVPSLANP